MIRHLPYLGRSLLLIALILASVGSGALRGQAQAAGTAVFCIGLVPQVMAVDAQGRPVSPHHCPDCTLASPAALLPATAGIAPLKRRDSHPVTAAPRRPDSLSAPLPRTRGPPVTV